MPFDDTSLGFLACGIASLFFGTVYVPIKTNDSGDGFFVQWVMSIAILIVGLIINALEGFPPFFPLAMLGGVSWAIGINGISASVVAGFFYGINFAPVIYIQNHGEKYKGSSPRGLPYVFAHYCGIFATATFFFVVYSVLKQNRPLINPRIAMPSYLAGSLWAVGQAAWFVANERLSQAISFPIIAMVPGVNASLWGVLYFREIRGNRNICILCISIIITMTGAILVGLSK